MLNDEHILEFNNIFKNCSSFNMQSSLLVQKPYNIISTPINSEYIQLLFSGNSEKGHWVCMYYSNNIIHIYDSLNAKCVKEEDKVFINRLFPNNPELKITFETVQSQTNSYDCGIFAIAFAISILFNICPCSLSFDITQMRLHLLKIFETRTIRMFPLSHNSAYEYINYDFSLIPIRRSIIHKYVFVEQKLHFNAEEINMIERKIQARLTFEQNKIINLYSRHNKSCPESIIPMEIDDGNASFNSSHYNYIIISLENTASEKVSLPSKNEICKNKDRNRVINNSDYVYKDKSEKILLDNKNVNFKNMNE